MRTNSFAEILTTDLAVERPRERGPVRSGSLRVHVGELGRPAPELLASSASFAPVAGQDTSSLASLSSEIAADRRAENLLLALLALASVAALAGNVLETVDWLHRWADFEALVKNCF